MSSYDKSELARQSLRREAVEEAYERLKLYHIDRQRIVFVRDEPRRSGGYGIVQRAQLYESAYVPAFLALHLNGPPQIVAVKQIRISAADDPFETKRVFTKEVLVWSSLKEHTGIAKFLGFYADFERGEAWLLSPWEPHGNISSFMKRRRLEVPEKLSLIYDTVDALTFLHQLDPPVCHGDVKSLNVLVNADCRAVLCDFGLARIFEDSGFGRLEMSTGFKGSIRWCSPELLDGAPRSPSSDVYAWAWLVWEMMTGEMPYQDTVAEYAIIRKIFESPRPQVDGASRLSDCLQLWELITRCWSVSPEERPTSGMCRTTVTFLPRCVPSPVIPHPQSPSPELLENLGDLERWKGNYEESAAYMKKALAIYEERRASKSIASVLRKQAAACYQFDDYVKAMELASAALEQLRTLEDDLATADALCWLGCSLEMQSMEDQAVPHFNEALEIFRIHGHDVGVVRCLERLGEMCRRKGQFTDAQPFLENAVAIASQSGDRIGETKATRTLGRLAWNLKDTAKATAILTNATETARQLGLSSVLCECLDSLGSIQVEEQRPEQAEQLFQECVSISRSTNQELMLARALTGLGDIRRERGELSEAEAYLEESCAILERISFQGWDCIFSASSLAKVKEAQGDKESALLWYEKAIVESRTLGQKLELSEWLTEKGRILQETQRYAEAALCFEASLVLDQGDRKSVV